MNKKQIKDAVLGYISSEHPDYAGIEPFVSAVSVKAKDYRKALGMKTSVKPERKIYSFTFVKDGRIKSVLRVTADSTGLIIKVNTSK